MLPGGRRHGVSRGSLSPARCAVGHLPAIAATHPVRTVPGAASPAPPGTPPSTRGQALGTRDQGHLFPPVLLQTQQERPAQQAHGHVVMPPRP